MCDCRKNTSLRFQNPSAIRQQSSGNKVANTSLRSDAASGLDEACDRRERENTRLRSQNPFSPEARSVM